jgi:hypothetical protein
MKHIKTTVRENQRFIFQFIQGNALLRFFDGNDFILDIRQSCHVLFFGKGSGFDK